MWRKLRNIFASFTSYADLSPDIQLRRQVNRFLRDRPNLDRDTWYEQCWQPQEIAESVAAFTYDYFANSTGLEFGRVRPSDRLVEDLHLPLICWFDWEIEFCEAFLEQFGIDLSLDFDIHQFSTVQDLIRFLNYQQLAVM